MIAGACRISGQVGEQIAPGIREIPAFPGFFRSAKTQFGAQRGHLEVGCHAEDRHEQHNQADAETPGWEPRKPTHCAVFLIPGTPLAPVAEIKAMVDQQVAAAEINCDRP